MGTLAICVSCGPLSPACMHPNMLINPVLHPCIKQCVILLFAGLFLLLLDQKGNHCDGNLYV